VFDAPAAAAFAVPGGAPALRDTGLLAPEMTVAEVDAFVLSGGSYSASTRRAARSLGCTLMVAASQSARRGRRSFRRALFDLDNGATRAGAAARPISISAGRRRKMQGWNFTLGSVGAA